jgi:protein phosphatase
MLHSFGAAPFRRLQSSPEDVLREALVRAHLDILDDASGNPRREGMGTTLTAALVLWPLAYVVHAGDSRCYLLRRGTLKALTKDQTVAAILVERGQLAPEAVRTSQYRHVLSNHLGGDLRLPEVQTSRLVLESWDGLLLATDGLSDVLGESELAEIASSPVSAHAVCHMLVESAAGRGARDDATALFARFGRTS